MKHITISLLALLLPFFSKGQNRKISVIEVSTAIYNKPLYGFRFLAPIPANVFRQVIHQHFSNYNATDFSEVVLLDQIKYPIISEEQNITLYFVLRSIENACEVTVCGQYAQSQYITVTNSPDLAMRLLLEISKMTEAALQTSLDIAPVFANQLPQTIVERYRYRHEETERDRNLLVGAQIQSSEAPQVLMQNSPFSANAAPPNTADAPIAEMLSERFGRYIADQTHQPTTAAMAACQNQRDSLVQQLQASRETESMQMSHIQDLELRLAALDPESQQAKLQLQAYKQRLAELEQREAAIHKLAAEMELKQKLLEQRLRYLAEYERTRDATVLLERIRELEAALQRLEFAQNAARAN